MVRVRQPFAALELSEPEPDLALVARADYGSAHPERAYLIVEVAESSLARDRGVKLRIYADCGVPEYWIVDPEAESILAQALDRGRFQPILSEDGRIHSVQVAGLVIDPAEIFAVPDWMPRFRAHRGDA